MWAGTTNKEIKIAIMHLKQPQNDILSIWKMLNKIPKILKSASDPNSTI